MLHLGDEIGEGPVEVLCQTGAEFFHHPREPRSYEIRCIALDRMGGVWARSTAVYARFGGVGAAGSRPSGRSRSALESPMRNRGPEPSPAAPSFGLNNPQVSSEPGPTMRGRSGMRLSERFKQYYQLVATSGAKGDQSLAVLASDIYLDMEETSLLIQRTRQEIARATLMEQLNQSFGIITPEMIEVVGGVKSILFGDADAVPGVSGPPPGAIEQAYRSPLEQ